MQFKYDTQKDLVEYVCPNCNQKVEVDCSDFVSELFTTDFGEEFQNLIVDCECGATTLFNFQIPIGEHDELDLEEEHFTYEQINLRHEIRNLIWAKRTDLKTLDRDKFNEERLKELPSHIQDLVKRNNMVTLLSSNINHSQSLNEEQTNVIKNVAMRIVTGEISFLKALNVLINYFAN